jgi:hypothetical protein
LPTRSGELSDGPIVFRQRISPKPAAKAITCPVPRECFALHGGLFRNVAYTVPCMYEPIAGEAATQRPERYFQARLPVFALIAANLPEFVEK